MNKQVIVYKKLSALLMERLQAHGQVTLIDDVKGPDGLARLRDALPQAYWLLGASLKLDAQLLDLAPNLKVFATNKGALKRLCHSFIFYA